MQIKIADRDSTIVVVSVVRCGMKMSLDIKQPTINIVKPLVQNRMFSLKGLGDLVAICNDPNVTTLKMWSRVLGGINMV